MTEGRQPKSGSPSKRRVPPTRPPTRKGPGRDPNTNQHGLSRSISPEVKLQVRRECGFGCVLCGAAVIQYDHFDPEFKDARRHDAAKIALLCGACHDRKTRGRVSTEAVAEARQHPCALRDGFVREALEIGSKDVAILLGDTICRGRVIIRITGTDLVSVAPPELPGAPLRVNAAFKDEAGLTVCQIVDNEIVLRASHWDIEFIGPRLIVKHAPDVVALGLTTFPGQGIRIDALNMVHDGRRVRVTEDGTVVLNERIHLRGGAIAHNGEAAIILS